MRSLTRNIEHHRFLFWLDDGGALVPMKVGRVGMDGSNPTILHLLTNTRPEFITVDLTKKKLYWSSSNRAKVDII